MDSAEFSELLIDVSLNGPVDFENSNTDDLEAALRGIEVSSLPIEKICRGVYTTVWPDGFIIFQYLAMCNNERLPQNITILPK